MLALRCASSSCSDAAVAMVVVVVVRGLAATGLGLGAFVHWVLSYALPGGEVEGDATRPREDRPVSRLTPPLQLFCFRLELSKLILRQRQEVVIVFWMLLPAHSLQQPVLGLQGARQVLSVGVAEGMRQAVLVGVAEGVSQAVLIGVAEGVRQAVLMTQLLLVLMAEILLAIGFRLRGAALRLSIPWSSRTATAGGKVSASLSLASLSLVLQRSQELTLAVRPTAHQLESR